MDIEWARKNGTYYMTKSEIQDLGGVSKATNMLLRNKIFVPERKIHHKRDIMGILFSQDEQ